MTERGLSGRILVAGATGFIGRNVAERLAADPRCTVTGIWNRRPPFEVAGLDWVRADLTKQQNVDRVFPGYDAVVQMAATTSGSKDILAAPYLHVTDNAVMNSLMLRAAFDHGVRHFLFPSCSIIYPSRTEPHDETSLDPTVELDARYFGAGWTKLYVERMCRFYANLGRTRFSVIRHTNLYGPHDKFDLEKSHVFGATVTKVLTAQDRIVVWGDGSEGRDLMHVDDMVDLVVAMLERQTASYDLVCAGAGHTVAVSELVQRIIAAAGRPLRVEHDLTKPSIPYTVALSHAKAKRDYGWTPRIDLASGIRSTLTWWERHVAPAG
jgi:GDP-L-fucose synthase